MDHAAALRQIADAAGAGRVTFSEHALTASLPDDGTTAADVVHVLSNVAEIAAENEKGTKWKVYGPLVKRRGLCGRRCHQGGRIGVRCDGARAALRWEMAKKKVRGPGPARREVRRPAAKTVTVTREVGGKRYSAAARATWDGEVGEYAVSLDAARDVDCAIAGQVALGAVSAEGFAFQRAALGLTGRRLADLLGVRPETVSRWETGAVEVDRAAWLALGGLVLERAGKPPALLERMERIAGT